MEERSMSQIRVGRCSKGYRPVKRSLLSPRRCTVLNEPPNKASSPVCCPQTACLSHFNHDPPFYLFIIFTELNIVHNTDKQIKAHIICLPSACYYFKVLYTFCRQKKLKGDRKLLGVVGLDGDNRQIVYCQNNKIKYFLVKLNLLQL